MPPCPLRRRRHLVHLPAATPDYVQTCLGTSPQIGAVPTDRTRARNAPVPTRSRAHALPPARPSARAAPPAPLVPAPFVNSSAVPRIPRGQARLTSNSGSQPAFIMIMIMKLVSVWEPVLKILFVYFFVSLFLNTAITSHYYFHYFYVIFCICFSFSHYLLSLVFILVYAIIDLH